MQNRLVVLVEVSLCMVALGTSFAMLAAVAIGKSSVVGVLFGVMISIVFYALAFVVYIRLRRVSQEVPCVCSMDRETLLRTLTRAVSRASTPQRADEVVVDLFLAGFVSEEERIRLKMMIDKELAK